MEMMANVMSMAPPASPRFAIDPMAKMADAMAQAPPPAPALSHARRPAAGARMPPRPRAAAARRARGPGDAAHRVIAEPHTLNGLDGARMTARTAAVVADLAESVAHIVDISAASAVIALSRPKTARDRELVASLQRIIRRRPRSDTRRRRVSCWTRCAHAVAIAALTARLVRQGRGHRRAAHRSNHELVDTEPCSCRLSRRWSSRCHRTTRNVKRESALRPEGGLAAIIPIIVCAASSGRGELRGARGRTVPRGSWLGAALRLRARSPWVGGRRESTILIFGVDQGNQTRQTQKEVALSRSRSKAREGSFSWLLVAPGVLCRSLVCALLDRLEAIAERRAHDRLCAVCPRVSLRRPTGLITGSDAARRRLARVAMCRQSVTHATSARVMAQCDSCACCVPVGVRPTLTRRALFDLVGRSCDDEQEPGGASASGEP